jgi:hypothetical protein
MKEINDNKSHFKFETADFILTQKRYDKRRNKTLFVFNELKPKR